MPSSSDESLEGGRAGTAGLFIILFLFIVGLRFGEASSDKSGSLFEK